MYKKNWICQNCGYETNKKQNYEKHTSRPSACEKRLKRHDEFTTKQNGHDFVKDTQQNGHEKDYFFVKDNKMVIINDDFFVKSNKCRFCFKNLSSNQRLLSHEKMCCTKVNPLQCPTCKKLFSTKQSKYQHIKKNSCIAIKDEKDKEIEELKQQLEEEKHKRKEAENSKSTIHNYITNNYFDHSINYNNYDNLSLEHISKEDIKRLFDNCRMKYPELSEDLTRMILSPKENQCIYLPEGQKSNTRCHKRRNRNEKAALTGFE